MQNEKAYNERYGITEKEGYKELMAFMDEMKNYFKDDYLIEVPQKEFERLCRSYGNLELHKVTEDFDDIENSRYGFVKMDGMYYSTYFMLIRYYTNTVMKMLRRRRRYQIESGFVFEDQVKEVVRRFGFEVQDDCKPFVPEAGEYLRQLIAENAVWRFPGSFFCAQTVKMWSKLRKIR